MDILKLFAFTLLVLFSGEVNCNHSFSYVMSPSLRWIWSKKYAYGNFQRELIFQLFS